MRPTLILCRFALISVVGCSSVTVREPLGESVSNAQKSLIGTWVNDDGEILEVRVSKLGHLIVGGLEWDDAKGEFKAESINVHATKAGKLQLIHAKFDPKSADERFVFGRYEIEDGKVMRVFSPVVSVFENAVDSGKLKGTVKKKRYETEVRLDASAEAVLDFITKTGAGVCFEKEPAITFKLLKRRE
jgi:hypothetical protein